MLGRWEVAEAISVGTSKIQMKEYGGVAVGDTLELSPGTSVAEVVTIVGFGSLLLAAPTRFAHPSGSAVRRLMEG